MPSSTTTQHLRLVGERAQPAADASRARPIAADGFEGLVALMVTDLVGFTGMVERLGDVAAQCWMHQHNSIVRATLAQRRGLEVAHTGDGVMAAFRSVSAALSCACEIHQRLAEHSEQQAEAPLRARIGVHLGEPLPEEGRLFGHCVNTAVRVCAEAAAGEILVTEVVRQVAGQRFHFASIGSRQLKGISVPVALFEVTGCWL